MSAAPWATSPFLAHASEPSSSFQDPWFECSLSIDAGREWGGEQGPLGDLLLNLPVNGPNVGLVRNAKATVKESVAAL